MVRFLSGMAIVMVAAAVVGTSAAPVPKPKPIPREQIPNTNALLKRHLEKVTFTRSTEWQGWETRKAFDGNLETSWFSAQGDTAAAGKTPWLAVTFPVDVKVSRVTVFGNREPQSPTGYFSLEGRLELLDEAGRSVVRIEREPKGQKWDFDFLLAEPYGPVRTVRFTSLKDETGEGESQGQCVGIAEIHVE